MAKCNTMERIGDLINRLKEQFEQHADAAALQATVQLLQQELAQQSTTRPRVLGTSKVAVVLPQSHVIPPEYEKYAPRPAASAEPVKEVRETVLVEEGNVSLLQKNGQLDMVFDPLKEIPTLSHQLHENEQSHADKEPESINDKHKLPRAELMEVLKETPIRDLRKAIGINDRFLFINELFRGDEAMYERSIKTINSFNIYPEAEYWISRELKTKIGWNADHPTVKLFDQLVRRRFS